MYLRLQMWLKTMLVKLDHFPKFPGENSPNICFSPPRVGSIYPTVRIPYWRCDDLSPFPKELSCHHLITWDFGSFPIFRSIGWTHAFESMAHTCCHVRQISQSACERKDLSNTMGRVKHVFRDEKKMMDLNEGEKPCTPYKLTKNYSWKILSAPVIPCEARCLGTQKTHVCQNHL